VDKVGVAFLVVDKAESFSFHPFFANSGLFHFCSKKNYLKKKVYSKIKTIASFYGLKREICTEKNHLIEDHLNTARVVRIIHGI